MHLEKCKDVLRSSTLFRDLNEIYLDLVLMVCEEVTYPAGEIIFRQGDPGDALYIIASGAVDILLEPDQAADPPLVIASLEQYATFGETILIEEGHRTATARCRVPTTLLRVPGERMVQLTNDYPEIGFRIMRSMAAELTQKLNLANMNLRARMSAAASPAAE
ncbi:MAG: cyclic nucleotide-binding domain-containing protein [Anaerolineae bacterium]|nr:cyclic nucleotide-binding domain-containing protein [Anaerolineae bacterium]HOV48627.1 cyclic nucleotide-binding domain-containing protein [Anaerolineae bacterium]